MKQREAYLVTLTRPEGASVADVRQYIREAVEVWGGQRRPDDPLFGDEKCPVFVVRRQPATLLEAQALRACGAELLEYEAAVNANLTHEQRLAVILRFADAAHRFLRTLIKRRR